MGEARDFDLYLARLGFGIEVNCARRRKQWSQFATRFRCSLARSPKTRLVRKFSRPNQFNLDLPSYCGGAVDHEGGRNHACSAVDGGYRLRPLTSKDLTVPNNPADVVMTSEIAEGQRTRLRVENQKEMQTNATCEQTAAKSPDAEP